MQLHISPSLRHITISTSSGFRDLMKVKGASRHISCKTIVYSVLILVFLLRFLFNLTAVASIESEKSCSPLVCFGRKVGPSLRRRMHNSPIMTKEIYEILQVENASLPKGLTVPESFVDFVADMKDNKYDAKTFAFKIKAMDRSDIVQAGSTQSRVSMARYYQTLGSDIIVTPGGSGDAQTLADQLKKKMIVYPILQRKQDSKE